MKHWSSVQAIKDRMQKEWDRGRILADQLHDSTLFPLRLPLKHPKNKELGHSFDQARRWIDNLQSQSKSQVGYGYELEWRECNHRQIGKNRLPVAVIFTSPNDALRFIGKKRASEQFLRLSTKTLTYFPELLPWISKKPLLLLTHSGQWPKIIGILKFFKKHPNPGIYLRQLDISGVDTKFFEKHKKLLLQLLDVILPQEYIDQTATGVAGFEKRYGLLAKPVRIRFRLLDSSLAIQGLSDLQIPVRDFSRLNLPVRQVFITENEINGLAFPEVPGALVIFGLGYGIDRLAGIEWLHDKKIFYWGDIDTHGFAILDQVRSYLPQTVSLLMDRPTVMAHRRQWGMENTAISRDLPHLNCSEAALYDDIRNNRLADALRLEQEKISFAILQDALQGLENKQQKL